MNSSILSYPERGKWGNAKWRGNCSGYIYRDLFTMLQPRSFCDPMMGSGTSIEVAKEMGILAFGLDLHMGHNSVADSILEAIGQEVDLTVSHPPYGGMLKFSGPGGMWGDKPHPGDLSHCRNEEEFHQKMQAVLLNQRQATVPGGYYGTIIGDYRRNGSYVSYQSEMCCRMPADELAGVLIKAQHNTMSDSKSYGRMTLPRVQHEYILLWQKKARPLMVLLQDLAVQQFNRLSGTWKSIVTVVMAQLGGQAPLAALYEAIERGAPEKLKANPNWKAKIRQVVNSNAEFAQVETGVWRLAA